jgi:hypothetical protein
MFVKVASAVIAVVLFIAYLMPVVIKLKEISLGVVVLIGVVMMLVDLWQSLRNADT